MVTAMIALIYLAMGALYSPVEVATVLEGV